MASAMRFAAVSMSRRLEGSGISALSVGLKTFSTSSGAIPRAASTRPSSSGRPWRWLMTAASGCASALKRSRQTRPRADAATPRNGAGSAAALIALRKAPMAGSPESNPS